MSKPVDYCKLPTIIGYAYIPKPLSVSDFQRLKSCLDLYEDLIVEKEVIQDEGHGNNPTRVPNDTSTEGIAGAD